MKQFALSGFVIAFISMNIYGVNDASLWRSSAMTGWTTTLNEFSQFEMPIIRINTVSGATIDFKGNIYRSKIKCDK